MCNGGAGFHHLYKTSVCDVTNLKLVVERLLCQEEEVVEEVEREEHLQELQVVGQAQEGEEVEAEEEVQRWVGAETLKQRNEKLSLKIN